MDDVDFDRPNVARVYDYLLGGSHNFAVDREIADKYAALVPGIAAGAQVTRSFLRRAVRYLARQDVRQFLDLGSGIPTAGNVHEAVRQVTPDARVVYVDHEPVAVAHGRTMLAGDDRTRIVQADLRDARGVLNSPEVAELIDFSRPVGLLMVAVLHDIPVEEDAPALVARYRAILAPGSHLAVSVPARFEDGAHGLSEHLPGGYCSRTREEIDALFAGFELVEPGLVHASAWRPDSAQPSDEHVIRMPGLVGIGRVPE